METVVDELIVGQELDRERIPLAALGDPFDVRNEVGIINSWLIQRKMRGFTAVRDWEGSIYLALCEKTLISGGIWDRNSITLASAATLLAKKKLWKRFAAVLKWLGQEDPAEPAIYLLRRIVSH